MLWVMRVGADSGGTFTDVVADDGRIVKVPSTPDDPGRAVRDGLGALGDADVLAHGTTVATNALLERRGARTALLTTVGFADLIEIARQDRPSLYDADVDRPEPLVPRELRYEVGGRLAADGSEIEPVGPIPAIPDGVQAVAVCLLHSDLDDGHERAVGSALENAGHDVSLSCDVSPEFREYERTVTTVVNASLRPVCRRYLDGLDGAAGEVLVMTSAGGLTPAARAAELPASLVLSGPAGGVRAAAAVAVACGFPDVITFDMGGTSTDVCLVLGGHPAPAAEREAAGLPIRLPSLDIHTIGAGGGSIARLDPGGALVVGPRSAGAVPGPVCYGRGGTEPTVTDADLVLGRIPAGTVLPGLGALDVEAARTALDRAASTAEGVVAVVNANMEQALRAVSVERGVDPRGLALVAFGGAGPLHACALAEALDMPAVIIPPRAGVLSAVGLVTAPVQRDVVRSWPTPSDHTGLDEALADLAATIGAGETSLDCRYEGQSHELNVPTVEAFEAEHRRRNGYARPGTPIEVVALRARAVEPAPLTVDDLPPPPARTDVAGPTVVAEPDCTVWVPEGWRAEVAAGGAFVLRRTAGSSP